MERQSQGPITQKLTPYHPAEQNDKAHLTPPRVTPVEETAQGDTLPSCGTWPLSGQKIQASTEGTTVEELR